MKKKRIKQIALGLGVAAIAFCLFFALLPVLTRGKQEQAVYTPGGLTSGATPETVRLVSLNLAHGRADGMHQLLCGKAKIENNLGAVADLLKGENPQIAAFQEADAPSVWSGRFNHVKTIADSLGMPTVAQAGNVDGLGLKYGTALVSSAIMTDATAYTFQPTWPTFSKGFVIASFMWAGQSIDVASIHLDFASSKARVRQLKEVETVVRKRGRPCILMGDFNCQWTGEESTLRDFAKRLKLTTWKADATDIVTFPFNKTRIDYVFVSNELEIVDMRVLDKVVSDHRAVVADIRLKKKGEGTTPEQ